MLNECQTRSTAFGRFQEHAMDSPDTATKELQQQSSCCDKNCFQVSLTIHTTLTAAQYNVYEKSICLLPLLVSVPLLLLQLLLILLQQRRYTLCLTVDDGWRCPHWSSQRASCSDDASSCNACRLRTSCST